MGEVKEKVQELPDEHRLVLNVIINAPNKYITKEKMLNQLGYEKTSSNERWIRRIISELSTIYAYPIGCNYSSDRRGYYMITTQEEKAQAIKSLTRLIEGSIRRREAVESLVIKE
ncbi:pathogenicity island protein [Staphylococcus pseudintermedius]|uniref:pathogenicity island protein n=1 Tax=Staphylococcus pseudintermedius TaxID=283734 RepID=UPI0019E468D8|nr:pathogenicity island protein [Staphylococcus pseudintermedius]EGQ3127586.1 pathogenicity island protein [Staphylococcus pseudintermedius]EGQ3222323.1 pathogenicity island protein [Staphylococcus pseudintermedius]EGQ3623628.1 pathogenicity island protein [Staphylococcus pseudintermedius]EHA6095163.1 pathogenicity island protein [Staphylococcus pseudintermedius]